MTTVPVPADQALVTAHRLALQAQLSKAETARRPINSRLQAECRAGALARAKCGGWPGMWVGSIFGS
jgi:hypothetical protein